MVWLHQGPDSQTEILPKRSQTKKLLILSSMASCIRSLPKEASISLFVLDYVWSLWAGAGWQHRHVHHHLRVFQSLRRRGRLRLLIMVTPLSLSFQPINTCFVTSATQHWDQIIVISYSISIQLSHPFISRIHLLLVINPVAPTKHLFLRVCQLFPNQLKILFDMFGFSICGPNKMQCHLCHLCHLFLIFFIFPDVVAWRISANMKMVGKATVESKTEATMQNCIKNRWQKDIVFLRGPPIEKISSV